MSYDNGLVAIEARYSDHAEIIGVYDTHAEAEAALPDTPPTDAHLALVDLVPAPWYGNDVYYAGPALVRFTRG